jgi:hypothetical protein
MKSLIGIMCIGALGSILKEKDIAEPSQEERVMENEEKKDSIVSPEQKTITIPYSKYQNL